MTIDLIEKNITGEILRKCEKENKKVWVWDSMNDLIKRSQRCHLSSCDTLIDDDLMCFACVEKSNQGSKIRHKTVDWPDMPRVWNNLNPRPCYS